MIDRLSKEKIELVSILLKHQNQNLDSLGYDSKLEQDFATNFPLNNQNEEELNTKVDEIIQATFKESPAEEVQDSFLQHEREVSTQFAESKVPDEQPNVLGWFN
jgi:predicted Ser/Thr protein kinase